VGINGLLRDFGEKMKLGRGLKFDDFREAKNGRKLAHAQKKWANARFCLKSGHGKPLGRKGFRVLPGLPGFFYY
jgi:hypothetical protein